MIKVTLFGTRYFIAAVGKPGNIYSPTGQRSNGSLPSPSLPQLKLQTIDLDASWAHWDGNTAKVHQMMADHPELELVVPGPPFYYIRSTSVGVSVRQLFAKYKIETARNYILRSRIGLNRIRAQGGCVSPGTDDPLCPQ